MSENDNVSGDAATAVSGAAGTDDAAQSDGTTPEAATAAPEQTPASTEEITYHAVEKDGQVTAIWEMQGRKHLRTIDPRSRQGQEILRLYTSEHAEEAHQQ
ncbi:MAG TPA: hypothetical protein VNA19_12410 [Pyrinomonadaceae bacterium]|jgi:hypothetical protein|nr:hypothetical protein [Pyrinomonadaceae bacterium]